ncbi:MAG TPA: hypothetical protein VIZ28_16145 [Chitinophagaceae bacterium]
MKILLPIAAVVIASFASIRPGDPLTNTKWDGANGLVVHFTKSDTVKLLVEDKMVAAALYKVQDSLLVWRDFIKSPSTCDTSIRGKYIYKIKEDILTFRVLSDRCEDRANIIQTFVLIKK